jgi:hypothetical protein
VKQCCEGGIAAVRGGRQRLTTVSPLLHASPTCTSFAINKSDPNNSALSTINSYARLSCSTETTDYILACDSITATATACTAYTGYAGAEIPTTTNSATDGEAADMLAESPLSEM